MVGLMIASGPVAHVVDEQPLLHADLGGGQARRPRRRTWSPPCRRPAAPGRRRPCRPRGHLLQDRVAVGAHRVRGHAPILRPEPARIRSRAVRRRWDPPPPAGGRRPVHRARASARRAWSAARTSNRSSSSGATPSTGAACRRSPSAYARPPAPRSRARAPNGGSRAGGAGPARDRTAARGRPGPPPRAPRGRGTRVWTRTRARRRPRPPDHPGRPGQRGPGPPRPAANRGASRCWSKSRKATSLGPVHPMEGRLGAHHQPGRVQVATGAGLPGHLDRRGGEQGGQLLGRARLLHDEAERARPK